MKYNPDTFCVSPFVHQSTKTDGSIKACCRSLPEISNIKNETLVEAWNNPALKQLRLDLLNGVRNSRCNVCWKLEDANVTSLRKKYNQQERHYDKALAALDTMQADGTLTASPAWIEFKLSNLCNLRCRMCHPMDSTKWFKDYKHIEHLHDQGWQDYMKKLGLSETAQLVNYDDNFFDSLPDFMTNIDMLAFAGGEALMDENHYRVLDSVMDHASDIKLRYATNMTILQAGKYHALDYWPHFKAITLAASLDGPPGLNEYIRGDANTNVIEENIKLIKTLPNTEIRGKLTIQALNIYYVPEAMEWFRSLDISTDMHFVTWPAHLDARIWTGTARQQIIQKLSSYIDNLQNNDYNIKAITQNILNYFSASDLYTQEKFSKFIEWNTILDGTRNESYESFEFLKQNMKHD